MVWEMRGSNGPYYTRSKRVNGRVVREYVGGGEIGRLVSDIDSFERTERLAEREAKRRNDEELADIDELMSQLCNGVEVLARAALAVGGYRRHKKGEWRRVRGQREEGD